MPMMSCIVKQQVMNVGDYGGKVNQEGGSITMPFIQSGGHRTIPI